MAEEEQENPEDQAPVAKEAPENLQEPPLAHKKFTVVVIASLLAALFIYDTGIKQLEWPPFWSVGLAINAGVVYAALLYSFPIANVIIGLVLLLAASFVGDIGYWLTGISAIVYLLTAYRPKKED